MKKKGVIISLAVAAIAGCAAWYISEYGFTIPETITLPWGYSFETGIGNSTNDESGPAVYVDSVAVITGTGSLGITNRFTGSVETQETNPISFDSSRKLAEIFISEGDEVKKGDPLFSYDTDEMTQKLESCDLELEEMANTLQSLNEQLEELRKAQAKAKPEEMPAYNIQVSSGENAIRRQEYNIAAKQLERAQLEKNLENSVVFSEMDGIVKSINRSKATGTGSDYGDIYGQGSDSSDAFITLLAMGDYRIKGSISEMGVYGIAVGEPVIVRPRANEEKIYHGVITKIDTEPISNNDNNSYYSGYSSGESASKYNFYVELTDEMDMMLGQHVIIELDIGQEEEKDGLWLPSYYIAEDESGSFIWCSNEDGRIEKVRPVFGDTDEELEETEIISGLSTDDYIAYPDDFIEEGARAIRSDEISFDNDDIDLWNDTDFLIEDYNINY